MSHNLAFPLLRTPDLDAVFSLTDRLLALGGAAAHGGTELRAKVSSRARLRQLLAAVPEAKVHEQIRKDADTPGDTPLPYADFYTVDLELPARQHARSAVTSALRVHDRLQVHWGDLGWPGCPELGLPWTRRHAHLQVNTHHEADDLDNPWTPDHVVYLHSYVEEHAAWLAARAGAEVIGEPHWF
ncbi:hypothetical protein ACFV1W_30650 [Kitasatospora sp. NPDC059648]|uniref:hypothetical protein n=1 Tax=Kitasatospora sp. NPDC059648 TaxID=3346894 RepID=UPI0036C95287